MRRSLALLALLLLGTTACGSDSEKPELEDTAVTPEMTTVELLIFTTSGNIASNHDDATCMFAGLGFELRDGEGTVLAVEDLAGTTATYADQPAAIATVASSDPYRCEVTGGARVEAANFYEATVTAYNPWTDEDVTSTATFGLTDTEAGPIEIELS